MDQRKKREEIEPKGMFDAPPRRVLPSGVAPITTFFARPWLVYVLVAVLAILFKVGIALNFRWLALLRQRGRASASHRSHPPPRLSRGRLASLVIRGTGSEPPGSRVILARDGVQNEIGKGRLAQQDSNRRAVSAFKGHLGPGDLGTLALLV